MNVYGSSAKICATCEYWSGVRNPKLAFVEVEKNMGKCFVTFKVLGVKRLCQEGCSSWKLWSMLK